MSTHGTATANGPSAGEQSGSTAQQAKDKAQETAQQAAGQAKSRVRDQVDQRSTEAGDRVGSAAQDARSVAEELRKQGKDQPAKLAEQAADRAESLGDYLTRSDGDTILRDLEDFGRKRPWAVIAGGVALGFAASRVLKASSSRRYESSYESPRRLPERSTAPSTTQTGNGLTGGVPTPRSGFEPAPDPLSPRTGPGFPGARARHRPLAMATQDPINGDAHAAARDRGIGELVKDLASQTSTLVRQEIKLAQAEVTEKGKLAGKGAGMLAGAAVAALLGLGALTALLVIALDSFMALWLAALVVMLLWFAVAAVLGLSGKKSLQAATPPVPQTVETVKEDIQWVKTRT